MEKKAKKPIWKKWWVWVLAVIIVGAIGSTGDGDDTTSDDPSKSVAVQEESTDNTESSSTDTSNVVETNEEKKDIKIKAGTYKIGTDLPAGEYLFFAKGMGYIEVSSNSRGTFDSIITNDNLMEDSYITVEDGQYLKLSGAEINTNQ